MAPDRQEATEIELYLRTCNILIADSASTSSSSLAKVLVMLGAVGRKVRIVRTFEQARDEINEFRPHLVVAEYRLGERSGLELATLQRAARAGQADVVFILVTGRPSETAVAQAAEEEVDAFIVKPFNRVRVEEAIRRAVATKARPSEYQSEIGQGLSALAKGDHADAEAHFVRATALSPKPVLAYYHLAETKRAQGKPEAAEAFYRAGLILSPNHYRCSIGLFDLYYGQGRMSDASLVLNGLTTLFPATPERLAAALKIAVALGRFQDVDRLYERFRDMDERDDVLVENVCDALVVAGQHALAAGGDEVERGRRLLREAAVAAGGRPKLLSEIAVTLARGQQIDAALKTLKRFPEDVRSDADYRIASFLVFEAEGAVESLVREGRALLRDGLGNEEVYSVMIETYLKLKKALPAQELAYEAVRRYKNDKRFEELLKRANGLPKTPSRR